MRGVLYLRHTRVLHGELRTTEHVIVALLSGPSINSFDYALLTPICQAPGQYCDSEQRIPLRTNILILFDVIYDENFIVSVFHCL